MFVYNFEKRNQCENFLPLLSRPPDKMANWSCIKLITSIHLKIPGNERPEIPTKCLKILHIHTGLSSVGVPGVPWHTQSLADQLTLFQPGGTDYAHLITPGFSDLPTALIKC